jgi:phage gpG-like protein
MLNLDAKIIEKELGPIILEKIGIMVMDKAKELVPKDNGMLRDSINYRVIGNAVYIGTDMPYAAVFEYGRNAGKMPPVEPIENWARKHGMKGAGWAIAMKIKKEGLPVGTAESPIKTQSGYRPFLRSAVFMSKSNVVKLIAKEMGVQ